MQGTDFTLGRVHGCVSTVSIGEGSAYGALAYCDGDGNEMRGSGVEMCKQTAAVVVAEDKCSANA